MDAFVLAGGKSSRMGQNKALLELAGVPLIERVLRALEPVASRRVLVANDPETYRHLGLPIVPDRWPGCAALGGIGTALGHATSDRALVLACDLPLVTPELLQFLVDCDADADVTLPATDDDGIHPLCAVYATSCLPHIEERVAAKRFKVAGFFDKVRVRTVEQAELEAAGFGPELLSNLNTAEELERARRTLS